MNIGTLIEVAIGVLFVWIMLAAITSQVQEWIAQWLSWRAKMLEESVRNILASDELSADFYNHPLIKSLHSKKGTLKPSYIPNRQFASVLFDMFINTGTERSVAMDMKSVLEKFRSNVSSFRREQPSQLKDLAKALDTLLVDLSMDVENADKTLAEARERIEAWFGDAMERLSGAYKRKLQSWTILIGIVLAAALNADSFAIADTLWKAPVIREAIVAQAETLNLEDLGIGDPQNIQQNAGRLQGLLIPLGWSTENMPADVNGWIVKTGGILLSGIAAAQGAPFWFDIMRKLLNFRSGGSSEPSKKEEAK